MSKTIQPFRVKDRNIQANFTALNHKIVNAMEYAVGQACMQACWQAKVNCSICWSGKYSRCFARRCTDKSTVYYQTTAPSGATSCYTVGDVWFDTDDSYKMYRWNGAAWSASVFGDSAIASLSANKITAGCLAAGVIYTGSIAAGSISAGTISVALRLNAACIYSGYIQGGSIVSAYMASGCIYAMKISGGCIQTARLTGACIITAKIGYNSNNYIDISAGGINSYASSAWNHYGQFNPQALTVWNAGGGGGYISACSNITANGYIQAGSYIQAGGALVAQGAAAAGGVAMYDSSSNYVRIFYDGGLRFRFNGTGTTYAFCYHAV